MAEKEAWAPYEMSAGVIALFKPHSALITSYKPSLNSLSLSLLYTRTKDLFGVMNVHKTLVKTPGILEHNVTQSRVASA